MKLGALIVLFHPSDAELERIDAVRRACDALVVVDNTPQPDPHIQALAEHGGFALIHQGNVGGISGAYNAGLEKLFGQVDAITLFDQDSTVPETFFPTMRKVCADLAGLPFLVGPRIFDQNTQRFLPELVSNGWALWRLRIDPKATVQRCSYLISSGCVISREAFGVLGRFDESLFIDHVDTEYCLRALARKVPLYVAPSLVLPHRIGAGRYYRLGPFTISAMNHSWLRRYYSARNAIRVDLRYGLRFPLLVIVLTIWQIWQIVQILLCERDKWAKMKGILYGFVDGCLGRLGSIEKTRPRLMARTRQKKPA